MYIIALSKSCLCRLLTITMGSMFGLFIKKERKGTI